MSSTEPELFVPVLTVMVDYGGAPFLWLIDSSDERGIGGCLCSGGGYRESSDPMSEGLWENFAQWAIEFDKAEFYGSEFGSDSWDWPAFHVRGIELARKLKAEVGDKYRVRYLKPVEDPNHGLEGDHEVLIDGSLLPLSERIARPHDISFCWRIISGGQTGADRAALDFAIKHHYAHGGWAPKGRTAEDGVIPPCYQLTELVDSGLRQRTKRNVQDSDGTLIVNIGEFEGGSLATHGFAVQFGKPRFVVQLDDGITDEVVEATLAWLRRHQIITLNVAGPRESKRPGIYQLVRDFLFKLDRANFYDLKPPLPKELIAAYKATTYRVFTGGGDTLDLHIGENSDALRQLLKQHGVDSAVFVTACNPFGERLSDAQNAAAMAGLKADLDATGIKWLDGVGIGDDSAWPPEPSVLALGTDFFKHGEYCVRYRQNVVVDCHQYGVVTLCEHPDRSMPEDEPSGPVG